MYAESYGENAEPMFLGQWHESCEGVALSTVRKARKVDRAYRWYLWALILLVLPFLFGIGWKLWEPPPVPQPVPVRITP